MPTRCSGRSPIARIRSTTCISCLTARTGTDRNRDRARRNSTHPDRRDAEGARRRRSRCRRASSWRAPRRIWEELKLPALTPQPPWHGYSLGDWARRLGGLRAPRRERRVGGERPRHLRAPPRRHDAGNAGARGGGEEVIEREMTVRQTRCTLPRQRAFTPVFDGQCGEGGACAARSRAGYLDEAPRPRFRAATLHVCGEGSSYTTTVSRFAARVTPV